MSSADDVCLKFSKIRILQHKIFFLRTYPLYEINLKNLNHSHFSLQMKTMFSIIKINSIPLKNWMW